MKKHGLLYAVFGLVFYLLFLIIEMPASWFAWGLNRFTQGSVRLDPITGSLWSGNGRIVIYYPQTTPHDLGNTEWRINPLWLFAGKIQMRWQTTAQGTQIGTTVRLGPGQVQVLDTEATFPAQFVSAFYPPAALISPQGQVNIHADKLTLDRTGVEGNAEILWQAAGSSLSSVKPLGDYRLQITGAGETTGLKLTTLHGDLDLVGQGQWQLQTGEVRFAGSATPRERASELEPLLKLLGDNQGSGKRLLTVNTRFLPPTGQI
jgi:general secretion pathway protein N